MPSTASSASGYLFNVLHDSSARKWRGHVRLLGVPACTGYYKHPWQAAAAMEWQLAQWCAHTGQPRSHYVSNAARLVSLDHADAGGVLREAVVVEPWDLSRWDDNSDSDSDVGEEDAGGAVVARTRPRRAARAAPPSPAAAAAAHVDDGAQAGAGGGGGAGDGAEEWEGGGGVWDCVDDIDKAFMPLEWIMGGGGGDGAAVVAVSGRDDGKHADADADADVARYGSVWDGVDEDVAATPSSTGAGVGRKRKRALTAASGSVKRRRPHPPSDDCDDGEGGGGSGGGVSISDLAGAGSWRDSDVALLLAAPATSTTTISSSGGGGGSSGGGRGLIDVPRLWGDKQVEAEEEAAVEGEGSDVDDAASERGSGGGRGR